MSDQPPSPDIRAIVDRIPRPAFAKDADLRFVAVNGAFLRAFGLRADAIEGKTAIDVFGSSESPKETQALVFGARGTMTLAHDGQDHHFDLMREGSLATEAYVVGTLEGAQEETAPPPGNAAAMDDIASIARHMKTGVVLLDRALTILAVNDMLYSVWSVDPAAAGVGDSFADFLDAGRDNRQRFLDDEEWRVHTDTVQASIARGDVPTREIALCDGRTLFASGLVLSGGRAMLTFDDVSLRDHTIDSIAALKETAETSERLMRSVLDNVPAAMIVYDKDNNFVLDNQMRHTLLPMHDSVMRPGSTLYDFVDQIHAKRTVMKTENAELDAIHDTDPEGWKAGRLAEYDAPFRAVERWTECGIWLKVTDRRLEDGTLIRLWTDISEIKEREATLDRLNTVAQTSLKTLRAAIEAMPDGMGIWDRHERLVIWNRRFSEQFPGVEIYPGKPVSEILHDFARTGVVPGIEGRETEWAKEKFLEWRAGIGGEHLFETHDGRWIKRMDRAASGGLRVGLRLDVTELKRREIELEKAKVLAETAERSKSEFLANMSHEIRTPMNGILGMAEILAKTELDERQRSFADIIVSSGNALLTIINDILDFSKIDAGQLTLCPEPFSLARAVDDVATLLSTRSSEKKIEIIVRIAPGMPDCLIGDAGRLRQIVTNLMGNAVKFTDEGHVLIDIEGTMRAPQPDGRTTVSMVCRVVDTGIGIPEERLDDVFESFSQVDGSSTRQYEGTGLGLAIATRLVTLMGGEIGCESVVDEGSTFWFEVPFAVDNRARKPKAPPTDLTGRRVLVIDDNAVNRAILLEQLGAWKFDGEAIAAGDVALALMRERHATGVPFDAVILDYHMPRMNGLDVARAIREDAALAKTPIVMLTSIDLDATALTFRALKIEGYLVKPARSGLLLRALVDAIREPNMAAPLAIEAVGEKDRVAVEEAATGQAPQVHAVPAIIPARAPAAEKPAPRPAPDVLVADDNAVNRLVMREMLTALGLTCVTADDGVEAVEAYQTRTPRLVLMDVTMPRMDGHDATRVIREIEGSGPRVTIIGATAHAAESDRLACLAAGMDDYVSKPISHKVLQRLILKWLGEERTLKTA